MGSHQPASLRQFHQRRFHPQANRCHDDQKATACSERFGNLSNFTKTFFPYIYVYSNLFCTEHEMAVDIQCKCHKSPTPPHHHHQVISTHPQIIPKSNSKLLTTTQVSEKYYYTNSFIKDQWQQFSNMVGTDFKTFLICSCEFPYNFLILAKNP